VAHNWSKCSSGFGDTLSLLELFKLAASPKKCKDEKLKAIKL
jgi:hypothetical protein